MSNRPRQPTQRLEGDWDFFSFPAFFGFSFGVFVATFLILVGLLDIIYLASLMLMAFSLAHLVTRLLARRRQEQRRDRAEEEERERRVLAARERAAARGEAEAATPRRRRRRRAT
jgi:hypothetical protein